MKIKVYISGQQYFRDGTDFILKGNFYGYWIYGTFSIDKISFSCNSKV